MRILVVDNNIDPDCWGASDLASLARQTPGVTVFVRRAPQEDLPESPIGYDRVIVSGSKTSVLEEGPWIDQLQAFVGRTLDASIPFLGVCYGHQIMARVLGGKNHVRRAHQVEYGWGKIELIESGSSLFRGMPRVFHAYQSHQDEVCELPKGAALLAKSDRCAIQAMQVQGRPAYGIQFHPERSLEAGEASLVKRVKENRKAECLNLGLGKKLFDPKVGETIFKNFLTLERE